MSEISPTEDLMREHGLLNRILLIYDRFVQLFSAGLSQNIKLILNTALIIRLFIEDYHEKMEENYIFPIVAKRDAELVKTLIRQHRKGRTITTNIINLSKKPRLTPTELSRLSALIQKYTVMYRAHESREDTVIFESFRDMATEKYSHQIGEEFEESEKKLLGPNGYKKILSKIMQIERKLGICDINVYG